MEDQIEEARKGDVTLEDQEDNKEVPVKEEKIVDLDDYMKEKGLNVDMKSKKVTDLEDPKNFEDENTVAVSYKVKTVDTEKRKKEENVVIGGTLMTDKWKPARRKRKNKKKAKLTEDDFPALS